MTAAEQSRCWWLVRDGLSAPSSASALVLPQSKPMSAAAQMFSGGVQLLILAAVSGEFAHFRAQDISRVAWFSLIYLIIAGSIVGYTAYVWLLHYESPTKVGTYAYVNPVVAVIVGAGIGGEVHRPAHPAGDGADPGQRGGDHDHAESRRLQWMTPGRSRN